MTDYDVLVYGPIFCDLIFTDLPSMPKLGTEIFANEFTITIGGSAIVAVGLQRLGAKVGLIADLGNDPLSRLMASMLDDFQIDRTLIREHPYALPQVTTAISFPQDRAFVTRFQKPHQVVNLEAVLRDHPAKHLHICSFLAAQDNRRAPHIAHDAGATVSFDPGWDESALRDPSLRRMIADVDLFLPSQSELCYIMQEWDVEKALNMTADLINDGMIIMKRGKQGAVARGKGVDESVAALSVNAIDTTGAGDSFDAGFLFQYAQGASLKSSLAYGTVCGALSTTRVGGATAAPTYQEVQEWLSKLQ